MSFLGKGEFHQRKYTPRSNVAQLYGRGCGGSEVCLWIEKERLMIIGEAGGT